MATLDWQLTHTGDATLVELVVTSDVDRHVEIESALQPVWPPRRHNRPAAGWDETGFEGVVPVGEPLVLGYASPAEPVEPPATIVETGPVPEATDETPTPEALVRSLGEAGPPRDAVPPDGGPRNDFAGDSCADSGGGPQTGTNGGSRTDSARNSWTDSGEEGGAAASPQEQPEGADSSPDGPDGETDADSERMGTTGANGSGPAGGSELRRWSGHRPGAAVDTWLSGVEGRLETAERLAAVETATEARAAVDDAGGIEAVRTLCERLDADRERIERLDAGALGRRVDEVEVPLSALERLA